MAFDTSPKLQPKITVSGYRTTIDILDSRGYTSDGVTITLWEGTNTAEISFSQGGICYMDEEIDLTQIKSVFLAHQVED